jgi:hypothetical protein
MTRHTRRLWLGIAGVGLVASLTPLTACKAAERGRVLRTAPVTSGAGTVEAERRRLQGTWELVSLETLDASGKATPVDASGRMTFDDYGNVRTEGQAKQSSEAANTVLSYVGRVVIDPDKKEWRLMDATPDAGASAAPAPVAADKIRSYEIVDDQLKLSLRDAAGKVTARVTWKRVQ